MRVPGFCMPTRWNRVALTAAAMAVVGAGLAVGSGSPLPAAAAKIDNQSAILVIAQQGDKSFTPPGACTTTTVAPTRCTAAVWVVNNSTSSVAYSTTACSTSPSLQALVLTSGDTLTDCTATPFLGAPGAAQTAVSGFPGVKCLSSASAPVDCRLFLVLSEANGYFSAPGSCSGVADITSPCMAASFDTTNATGGTRIEQPDTACPFSGDDTVACSADPGFLPATMTLTLPAKGTPAPATPPVHGPVVDAQAVTVVVWPSGDLSFNPPGTCGSWGINPVARCTAAIIDVTGSSTGGSYATAACYSLPPTVAPCTSNAFMPSMGKAALSGYPGSVCFGPAPAPVPPSTTPGRAPVVNCHLAIVLTPAKGAFNVPGMCKGTTIISSACTLAVYATSTLNSAGGETAQLITPTVCLAAPADPAIITASCTSPGWTKQQLTLTLPESGTGDDDD